MNKIKSLAAFFAAALSLAAAALPATKPEEVEKAAMIIRSYGHASTETLVATPWKEFLSSL